MAAIWMRRYSAHISISTFTNTAETVKKANHMVILSYFGIISIVSFRYKRTIVEDKWNCWQNQFPGIFHSGDRKIPVKGHCLVPVETTPRI